jgi:hypothetical protein
MIDMKAAASLDAAAFCLTTVNPVRDEYARQV